MNSHSSMAAPEILLEPGDDWLEHLSDRLHCDPEEISDSCGESPLGAKIQTAEQAKAQKLKRRLKRRQTEVETLQTQLHASQAKLSRVDSDKAQDTTKIMGWGQSVENLQKQLIAKQKENHELRMQMQGRRDGG